MDINTALRAIENKDSSELARGQAVSGDVKTSAEELAALLSQVSEAPPARLRNLSISSKDYAHSYKTLAIAFNATLRNTRN